MSRGRTSRGGERRAKRGDSVQLAGALKTIAAVLEAPRDRLGRLDCSANEASREARETLRLLSIAYGASSGEDVMAQCAAVARAVLAKVAS